MLLASKSTQTGLRVPLSSPRSIISPPAWMGGIAFAAGILSPALAPVASAGFYGTPGSTYAFQQTSFYCGEGTMQMMLSANAVGAANPGFVMPTQNALYTVAQKAQFLASGFNIKGTLPSGLANATANPGALPNAAPGDNWSQYISLGTLAGADQAERNIANALAATQIPVGAVVNYGGHWDAIWGVQASAVPVLNTPYLIQGFAVADPWTGYALANPSPGQSLGLGIAYVSNVTVPYLLPNGAVALYNPFLSNVFEPIRTVGAPWGGRYVSVADPLATTPPAPDNGSNNSIPLAAQVNLSTAVAITAATAITDAANDVTNGSVNLSTEPGFNGGDKADANTADVLQVAEPGITGASVNDFLVPFKDPNGAAGSNYTGIAAINPYTGQIDTAQSIPITSGELTLAEIQALGRDLLSGNVPQDNVVVPEPAAIMLVAIGGLVLSARRRRGQAMLRRSF